MPDNDTLLVADETRPGLVGFDETSVELVLNEVNQGRAAGLDSSGKWWSLQPLALLFSFEFA